MLKLHKTTKNGIYFYIGCIGRCRQSIFEFVGVFAKKNTLRRIFFILGVGVEYICFTITLGVTITVYYSGGSYPPLHPLLMCRGALS